MPTILADHNAEGHLDVLIHIWTSPEWNELWEGLNCEVCKFKSVGLESSATDADLWHFCQKYRMLLLTGNRNADGEDSLEMVSRLGNQLDSLPILTLSDADRILQDRHYAEAVASRILDIMAGIDSLLGTRRLYVP